MPHSTHALLLSSPSPGRIIRFLERYQETLQLPTGVPLYLTHSLTREHLRLLLLPEEFTQGEDWLIRHSDLLWFAFPPTLASLTVQKNPEGGGTWQGIFFSEDNPEPVQGSGDLSPLPFYLRWQPDDRLRRQVSDWASQHDLPVQAIPFLFGLRPPVTDYLIVESLDQRSLLIEDSPRLYRFTL